MTVTEQCLRKLEDRVNELKESIEIMGDKRLLRSIQRGLKDLKVGKYSKYEDIKSLFEDI